MRKFSDVSIREGLLNCLWNFFSSLKNNNLKKIHVIGDSHTGMFRFSHYFIVHHLGPVTAHNLSSPNSLTNSKYKLNKLLLRLKNGSRIIFVAGEIDCRLHIYNHFMKNKEQIPLDNFIFNTVGKYIDVVECCASRGLEVFICSIPPATKQRNKYKYQYVGDIETQAYIKQKFNEMLKEKCLTQKIKFIDLYNYVVTQDGLIKEEFQADEVHLNRKAAPFVINKLFSS